MNLDTPIHLPKKSELEEKEIPNEVIEVILDTAELAIECSERVRKEGVVVRDMSGQVTEHPAIKTLQKTVKLYTDLIKQHSY